MSRPVCRLVLLLAFLIWGGLAEATVSNRKVVFREIEKAQPFQPGISQHLTVEMGVAATAMVGSLDLRGPGWTVANLTRTPSRSTDLADFYTLEFDLTTANADEPLILSYDLDGETVIRPIDYSEAKLGGRGRTERVEHLTVSPRLSLSRDKGGVPEPAPLELNPRWLQDAAQNGPAPRELPSSDKRVYRSITVTGRFGFYKGRTWVPAWGATVFIMADTWGPDTPMGNGTVDVDGNFSIVAGWWLDPLLPNIYAMFVSGNWVASVQRDEIYDPDSYTWRSDTFTEVAGTTLDMGGMSAVGTSYAPLYILGNMMRAHAWLVRVGNYQSIPHVDVNYPADGTTSHYDESYYFGGEPTIFITSTKGTYEPTHIHEYGHHFIHTYGYPIEADYCDWGYCDEGSNWYEITDDGCGHCAWCPENYHVAFSEGWPEWFSWVVEDDWKSRYSFKPVHVMDFDAIEMCTDGSVDFYSYPNQTEGFFAALLQDIVDLHADQDPYTPGFGDPLHADPWLVMQVVSQDDPITPWEFIINFKARNPDIRAPFWEVCRNNGYTDLDTTAPVTGAINCPDHPKFSVSPDNRISVNWSGSYDDFSGVAGFDIAIARNYPEVPGFDMTVDYHAGEYTLVAPPGYSYYITLRAVDRAGNWDQGYDTYGPIGIREVEAADLAPVAMTDYWDYPLVPKNGTTASAGEVVGETSPLYRNFYWNASYYNSGDIGVYDKGTVLKLDGEFLDSFSLNLVPSHEFGYRVNKGPVYSRGGRHTVHMMVDGYEQLMEPDESDNFYGHQWIWSAETVVNGLIYQRERPPRRDGGWEHVVNQTIWYNCDGLNLLTYAGSVPDPWVAMAVWPLDNSDDYDLRIHEAPSDADSGFEYNLGYSARPAGYVDAVLVNAENRPAFKYVAGVLNQNPYGMGEDYFVQLEYAQTLPLVTTVTDSLLQGEGIALFTFDLATAGLQTIHLQQLVGSNPSPVYAAWFNEGFQAGNLLDYQAVGQTDEDGYLLLDIDPAAGSHALLVWRDPVEGGFARIGYTLSIRPTDPDLTWVQPVGWDAPLLPQIYGLVTTTSGPAATILVGESAMTYMNTALTNIGPVNCSFSYTRTYVDRVLLQEAITPVISPGEIVIQLPSTPVIIPGGRHTVSMEVDGRRFRTERDEGNNKWASQYVWRPDGIGFDNVTFRAEPPFTTADWEWIYEDEILFYNCDGLETPTFMPTSGFSRWAGVAVMPAAASDVDLRLFMPNVNARQGFDEPLVSSYWGTGESDFVVVNLRNVAQREFDIGMTMGETQKVEEYSVVIERSVYGGNDPEGVIGTYSLAADEILQLHEINLTVAARYRATLTSSTPTVDLGFSLYGPHTEYANKTETMAEDSAAWLAPGGALESFEFTVSDTALGYHCLAVWKVDHYDGPIPGTYTLALELLAISPTPEGELPLLTGLESIYPNPFNPQTTVAFSNTRAGDVTVAVYDLSGSRIRTLVDQMLPAGRHSVVWDGRDDGGRRLASGSYVVQLTAGEVRQTRKLVLLK